MIFPFESMAYRTPSPPGIDELNRSRELVGSVPALGLLPGIPAVCFGFDSTCKPLSAVTVSGIGRRLLFPPLARVALSCAYAVLGVVVVLGPAGFTSTACEPAVGGSPPNTPKTAPKPFAMPFRMRVPGDCENGLLLLPLSPVSCASSSIDWLYRWTFEADAAPAVPPTSAPPRSAATFAARLPISCDPVAESTPFAISVSPFAALEAKPAPAALPAAVSTLPPPRPPMSAPPAACNSARLLPPSSHASAVALSVAVSLKS